MYHVMRIALCGVGHPEARFNPLVLDFRDQNGLPKPQALVWLDNGGGKTSQISLVSSLILPNQRDFLGSRSEKERRSLTDYVLPKDVSHVFVEWGRPAAGLFAGYEGPTRLVTGQVITRNGDELDRVWYSFYPVDSRMTFDDLLRLVHTPDGHRQTPEDFIAGAQALAKEVQGNARFISTLKQGRWTELLLDRGIDPGVFRYQLKMNEDEGSAGKFLNFRDGDSFVDFVLGLVMDPDDLNPVVRDLGRLSNEYAAQPYLQAEKRLCEEIDDRTPPLVEALDRLNEAKHTQRDLLGEGVFLLAALVSSADAARLEAEQQRAAEGTLEIRKADLEREQKSWADACAVIDETVARKEHDRQQADLRQAEADRAKAGFEAAAWAITEQVLRRNELMERTEALRRELERLKDGSVDLYEAQDSAAARYKVRLDGLLSGKKHELDNARTEERQAQRLLSESNARVVRNSGLEGAASARHAGLTSRIGAIRKQLIDLQAEGLVRQGEGVAGAISRLKADLEGFALRLAGLDAALKQLESEARTLQETREKNRTELALLEQHRGALEEKLEHQRARMDGISAAEEVQEWLAGQSFDPVRQESGIANHLSERLKEARAQAVNLEVQSRAAVRARTYLDVNDVLPPEPQVDEAVNLLRERGLSAQSGWSYLIENFRKGLAAEIVLRRPDLPAGVVVKAGELANAEKLLAPLVLDAPLVVSEPLAWTAEPIDGRDGTVVIPADPAHYDTDAAKGRKPGLDRTVASAEKRLADLAEFDAYISRLLVGIASIAEECRRAGPAYYEMEIASAGRREVRLRDEVSRANDRETEIEDANERLLSERKKLEGDAKRAENWHDRLLAFLPQAEELPDLLRQTEDAASVLKELQEALRRDRQQIEELTDRTEGLRELITQCEISRTEHERALGEIGDAGARRQAVDDPTLTTTALRQMFLVAKQALHDATLGSPAGRSLEQEVENLQAVSEGLRSVDADVLARAAELLTTSDGETEASRSGARDRSEERKEDLVGAVAVKRERVSAALADLQNATAAREKLGVPEVISPEVRASLPESALEAQVHIKARLEDVQRRRTQANEDSRKARERVRQAEDAVRAFNDIAATLRASLAVAGVTSDPLGNGEILEQEDGRARVMDLGSRLRAVKEAADKAEQELRAKARAFKDRVMDPAYAMVTEGSLRKGFVEAETDEALAELARAKHESVRWQLQQAKYRMENLREHRENVVVLLSQVVEDALRVLDSIAANSKLPADLEGWSEQQYIRINHAPVHKNTINSRLAAYVDSKAQDPSARIDGLDLLLSAVKRVVDPITANTQQRFNVTILKPHESLPYVRAGIEEVARWSGGQKLTTALLIYCVLVRTRMKARGTGPEARWNTLFLDNPTGKANQIDLVSLQLRVAKEYGVQLVIFTGVNDRNAISSYGHILRLRNKKDRNSTRFYVELSSEDELADESGIISRVTAARLGRVEDFLPDVRRQNGHGSKGDGQ